MTDDGSCLTNHASRITHHGKFISVIGAGTCDAATYALERVRQRSWRANIVVRCSPYGRRRLTLVQATAPARVCIHALAEEVGRELAQRGATVVCGGLGGVMEAVCRGAKSAGGRTVGILPGTSARDANPFVDIPIVTGLGQARNAIVVLSGRAVIAIGGEYGTLSEIAFALKFGIPVIGLGTWQLAREGKIVPAIAEATSAREAVEAALSRIVGN